MNEVDMRKLKRKLEADREQMVANINYLNGQIALLEHLLAPPVVIAEPNSEPLILEDAEQPPLEPEMANNGKETN